MIYYDPKFDKHYSAAHDAARKLHAEDIRVGDYVAIADVTYEYASCLWNWIDAFDMEKDQAIRIQFLAHEEFDVYHVKSICLPFIHTLDTKKKNRVFDVRRTNVFRISVEFAKSFKESVNRGKNKKGKKRRD